MEEVIPRLKWIGGAWIYDGYYSVAVKFTAKNGNQYGSYEMVRFPRSVAPAVARLTAQMQAVADTVEQ